MAQSPAGKPDPSKKPLPKKPAAAKSAAGAASPSSHAATSVPADWERIELDYRAGIKTLRQIADEHGITHGAINKRAKRDGWERDLGVKIQAKADALVSREAVSSQVSMDTKLRERAVIDANAQAVADIRLAHRRDIHRARRVTNLSTSTLLRKANAGDLAGACRENPRWNRGTVAGVSTVLPGLQMRGDANAEICLEWRAAQ